MNALNVQVKTCAADRAKHATCVYLAASLCVDHEMTGVFDGVLGACSLEKMVSRLIDDLKCPESHDASTVDAHDGMADDLVVGKDR